VLPFVCVGVEKIPVKRVAGKFIIEADIIETGDTGIGSGKLLMNSRDKLGLTDAIGQCFLWSDAGD